MQTPDDNSAAPRFAAVVLTAPPEGMTIEAGGAYVKVDGREALLRSVELFLNRDNIAHVVVVFPEAAIDEAKRKFGNHFAFSGVKLAAGGETWVEQLAAGGKHLDEAGIDASHVIVHDGARPAVPQQDVDALIEAAAEHDAVTLAAPVRNPLVELTEDGSAGAIHPPDRFMHLLTPQAYVHERFKALAGGAGMGELHLVKGSPLNVRIGGGGEASLVRAMINLLPKPKTRAPTNPFEEAQW